MTQTAPEPLPAAAARPAPLLQQRGVLTRDTVRVVPQPALVDCSGTDGARTLTVVPLMDGDRVAGLEVRCSCGASTLVECVYDKEAGR
jgi:mRNA-degrading endonuclease toxin of MazEF toxin-antitoxin module